MKASCSTNMPSKRYIKRYKQRKRFLKNCQANNFKTLDCNLFESSSTLSIVTFFVFSLLFRSFFQRSMGWETLAVLGLVQGKVSRVLAVNPHPKIPKVPPRIVIPYNFTHSQCDNKSFHSLSRVKVQTIIIYNFETLIFLYRCVLSFIGVYYITSERKQEESEEQLLLTNADLFPGMFSIGLQGFQ